MAVKGLMELNKGRETRLQLESNLKESQLNTLKGQINPHFMFNSLNNIRGLMLEMVPADVLLRFSLSVLILGPSRLAESIHMMILHRHSMCDICYHNYSS